MTVTLSQHGQEMLETALARGRINAAQQTGFLEQLRLPPVMIEHRRHWRDAPVPGNYSDL